MNVKLVKVLKKAIRVTLKSSSINLECLCLISGFKDLISRMKILKNKFLWVTLSIVALIVISLSIMPKSIDMDLDKVGNGQNSVVFIYDPGLVVSNQQATEINKARDVLGETVNFLIAKDGDPTTDNFRRRFQARSADVLFFNPDGELIDRQVALVTADTFVRKFSGK